MRVSKILGADGEPFTCDDLLKYVRPERSPITGKNLQKYAQNLFGISAGVDTTRKAMNAHEVHAWVYTAAVTQGLALSSLPFQVFMETEEVENKRRRMAKKAGRDEYLFKGDKRKAVGRWINNAMRESGIMSKGLEPDFDHPLMDVFKNPNPYMKEAQLWFITGALMALRGNCFWILTDKEGQPLGPNEEVGMIWPFAPEYFIPIWNNNQLVGWNFIAQKGFDPSKDGQIIPMRRSDVIQMKIPDPFNFWDGLSPLAPLADEILTDTKLDRQMNSVLDNGATPSGIMSTEQMLEDTEVDQIEEHWNATHGGTDNSGRMALLWGGMKYQQLSLTPEQMQQIELKKYDRDTILSGMGTPKASVGITDDLNYATQLSQDRNFWTKRMFPNMRIVETEVDGRLLGGQNDNIVGMFNITKIDALRLGLKEQVEIADMLAGDRLHMPPAQALARAGVEFDRYETDETALVSLTLIPAEQAAEGFSFTDPADSVENKLEKEAKAKAEETRRRRIYLLAQRTVMRPGIQMYGRAYQKWIRTEKSLALDQFDNNAQVIAALAGKMKTWTMMRPTAKEIIIPDVMMPVNDTETRMAQDIRPAYDAIKDLTYNLTSQELGSLVVFNIDDPALIKVVNERTVFMVNQTPETLQKELFDSLTEGVTNGETLIQLRQRVSATYNGFASPAKTLQVARTESGGIMNTVRNEMFNLSGITVTDWIDSGGSNVRDSHRIFSNTEPKPQGFNYLSLIGKSGTLSYPQDPAAPADETVNCACMQVAVLPSEDN